MGIYGGSGLTLFLHNRHRAERDKIESSNADTDSDEENRGNPEDYHSI